MNKLKVFIVSTSIIFLCVVAYKNYSLPLDVSLYTPNSFYRGSEDTLNISAKEYYNQLNNLSYTTDYNHICHTELREAKNIQSIESGLVYFVGDVYDVNNPDSVFKLDNSNNITNVEDETINNIDENGVGLFKDDSIIICPTKVNFINNNIKNSSIYNKNDSINIELAIGDRIILIFKDVKSWWCHMHNSGITEHSKVVGNSSLSVISSALPGQVIGLASSNTIVEMYSIPDSLYEDGVTNMTDDLDITKLDKISLKDWLHDGSINIIE